MKRFLVTVDPYFGETVFSGDIRAALEAHIKATVTVAVYDPESDRKDRGKIDAIKRIRQALQCGLGEAKLLVDAAYHLPSHTAKWAGVTVVYHGQTASPDYHAYQVIVSE